LSRRHDRAEERGQLPGIFFRKPLKTYRSRERLAVAWRAPNLPCSPGVCVPILRLCLPRPGGILCTGVAAARATHFAI